MSFFSNIRKRKEALVTRHYERKAKQLKELRAERIKLEGRAKIQDQYNKEKMRIAKAQQKTENPIIKGIKKKLKENRNKKRDYGKGIYW